MENIKTKLFFCGNKKYSIFLKWEIEGGQSDRICRIEMKDETGEWVTKYWGHRTDCEVKGLGPEKTYSFRLCVSLKRSGENIYSDILTTATKGDYPILYYLFKSAERGDVNGLRAFINERNQDILGQWLLTALRGETGLIKGVKRGSIEVVRLLLETGASVDQEALATGRTPLMYASSLGFILIAQELIENGANINATDRNNCGPLHYAVDHSQLEMVQFCLKLGLNVNMKDGVGWTPLSRAVVLNSSEDVIRELLLNNADIEIKDKSNKNALCLAELQRNKNIMKLLLEHKSQVDNIHKVKFSHNKSDMENGVDKINSVLDDEIKTVKENTEGSIRNEAHKSIDGKIRVEEFENYHSILTILSNYQSELETIEKQNKLGYKRFISEEETSQDKYEKIVKLLIKFKTKIREELAIERRVEEKTYVIPVVEDIIPELELLDIGEEIKEIHSSL